LKANLQAEGFHPVALTWIGDDITGPFSFTGYGDDSPFELRKEDGGYHVYRDGRYFTRSASIKELNSGNANGR
ncbi:hypothetical protein, partial [Sporomusa sp.]|uniref:hypothetical protein n=1 Tax=Sporomusa sp. TaxID=2078658 RepID=UPI002B662F48